MAGKGQYPLPVCGVSRALDRMRQPAGAVATREQCVRRQQQQQQFRLKAQILSGRLDLLATQVLGLQLQPFHRQMLALCHDLYRRQAEGLLLAPRGFGKSCLATVCFTLWLLLHDRNIRVLIVSSTATKAESFVREIRTHLQSNQTLRHLFGDLVDLSCWRQGEMCVKGRSRSSKEASVTARGCSGAVVGLHFDVHLIDDLVNEDNARTKGQRDKLKDWVYMSLDPTLQPHGCRLIAGTRYHPDDFYNHLLALSQPAGKGARSQPSEAGDLSLLRLQALQGGGRSLWPQKFSIEWLQRKQQRMGRMRFNAQYQNDCALMRGNIFRQQDIRSYNRSELDLRQLTVVQGVDVAIGQQQHHDWFALVTKGYDSEGNAYTLDVVRGHYSFQQQMMVILYKAGYSAAQIGEVLGIRCGRLDLDALFAGQPAAARTQYGVAVVGDQTQAGGDGYVIRGQRDSEQHQQGQSVFGSGWRWFASRRQQQSVAVACSCDPSPGLAAGNPTGNDSLPPCTRIGVEGVAYQRVLSQYLLQRVPALPLVCLQQRLDKRSRMTLYAARFESHREFFPADNSCDALLEELLLFPDGQHDDLLDAHEMAHRVAMPLLHDASVADDAQVRVFV